MTETVMSRGNAATVNKVKAGQAFGWIAAAWTLFRRQPGQWVIFFLASLVVTLLAGVIPLIGQLLSTFLQYGFTAGFLLCARKLDDGGEIELPDLFAAFREHWPSLLALMLCYLLVILTIVVACVVIMIGGGIGMAGTAKLGTLLSQGQADMPLGQLLGSISSGIKPLLMVLFGLLVVLVALLAGSLFMFAPALIVLDGVSVPEALKGSFAGVWRNWAAMLVLGVSMLLLFMLGSIPLLLGLLVVGPLYMLTLYTAWRDIYVR